MRFLRSNKHGCLTPIIISIKLGTDHLNFWVGPGLFLMRPSFFFLLPENQDIFFSTGWKTGYFIFGQSESRFFFLITI